MKTLTKIPITSLLIALTLALACIIGLVPKAQAVVPPPDGAYPNFTTAEGQNALHDLTSGAANTALGAYSLFTTTTASFNTAVGALALDLNTGDSNTAVGVAALLLNTGTENTAVGVDALGLNTSGVFNAAVGAFALYNNTIGSDNTANGNSALFSNTTGDSNTANGSEALTNNTTGANNTAIGFGALFSNTEGGFNTAVGLQALTSTTGAGVDQNTAVGSQALLNNTVGVGNTAVGAGAMANNTQGNANTAIGVNALSNVQGSGNIGLGVNAGQNTGLASNVICIGAAGVAVDGSCFIGQIFGKSVDAATDTPVIIDSTGKLGTTTSSQRFKKDIKPMDQASEAILRLKPVTFHYKSDPSGVPRFGLVAEDVAKVNPDLIVRDVDRQILSVRYEAVNAMLLNEFLKEHRKVEQMQEQIEALTAGLQKVSARLELSEPASQTVKNDQ